MKRYSLVMLAIIALLPAYVTAAGVQVMPSKIEAVVPAGESRAYTIAVANPTRDVQIFEVYPDAFEDEIFVNPKSFNLEAGERREVTITVQANEGDSQAATSISIVGRPLASGSIKTGTGIKLPITIVTTAAAVSHLKYRWSWTLGALAAGTAVLGLLFLVIKKKRSSA